MRARTMLGVLALIGAAVSYGLGGVEGRVSALILGIAGLSWALGPVMDRGDE